MIILDRKHRAYLSEQLTKETIALGTPVYKTVNACLFASLVGFKENYRSAFKKKDGSYLFFAVGNLLFRSGEN
jgi:hypothetical protein